jgi:peroxiredoxin
MLDLGTIAPDFSLPDPKGKTFSLKEACAHAKACLVIFMCNHCPYVKHLKKELAALANEYQKKGVVVVAINSNDVENYPEDSPAQMLKDIERFHYSFPYLIDSEQEVAKSYQAACTPDFYVLDTNLSLVYRGQFDDSRPGDNKPVTGTDVRTALDAVLTGTPVNKKQFPSIGCNIKWKPGNELG